MNYLRIAGAVVVAALLAFLWWRVSLSFSQGDTIDAQAAQIGTLEAARARDTRVASEMRAFRDEQATGRQAFLDALNKKPLTLKVTHVDPTTGKTDTCTERDPVRYRELFNAGVTGAAAGVP